MALSLEPIPEPSSLTSPPAETWTRLLAQSSSPTPFASWEWQSLWWKHFGQDSEWYVYLAREGDEIVGIAPLYRERGSGHFKLIGGEDLSDYLDILAIKGQESLVWRSLLGDLGPSLSEARAWDLHCIPAHSPTLQFFPGLAQDRGYRVTISQEEVCPLLSLPSDWEGYLATLDGKDRHELRRKMRRGQKASPPLHFRQCSEEECARDDIKAFISLHRKSRPEKDAFMDPHREAFFQDLSHVFAEKGWFRLYILEREEQAVAAMFCFDHGQTLYLYNSGYDPAYSALSPGILLLADCLQDAISRGKKWFDFMRGSEEYKYRLGAVDAPIYRILAERP